MARLGKVHLEDNSELLPNQMRCTKGLSLLTRIFLLSSTIWLSNIYVFWAYLHRSYLVLDALLVVSRKFKFDCLH